MRLYCSQCKEETEHVEKNETFGTCLVCGMSNWIEEYPIRDDDLPNTPLVAARQRYQREKHAYYKALGREDPYYQDT